MMENKLPLISKFLLITCAFWFAFNGQLFATDQVVINNNNNGAGSLRQAIADVSDGGIVTFNLSAGNETIVISSELVIAGKGLSIDGSNTFGSGTDISVEVTAPGVSAWRVFNINANGKTILISHLTVRGGHLPDGDNPGGGIFLVLGELNLSYVTVKDSQAPLGGGIAIRSTSPCSLDNVTIMNNISQNGGGLYNGSATITLSKCLITGNTSSDTGDDLCSGGGISNSGILTIDISEISSNTCTDFFGATPSAIGGGISNSGTVTINNSTLKDNSINSGYYAYGGGIGNNEGSTCTISNSTISGNAIIGIGVAFGGGILFSKCSGSVTNSTICGNSCNTATYCNGGGICNAGATLNLKFTTVANNSAGGGGAGMYNVGFGVSFPGSLTVENTIVSINIDNNSIYDYNQAAVAALSLTNGILVDNGHNIVEYQNVEATSGGFNALSDILYNTKYNAPGTSFNSWTKGGNLNLGNLNLSATLASNGGTNQTLAISAGSFAINSGLWDASITTDQRGTARHHFNPAIGAFELNPAPGYWTGAINNKWNVTGNWSTNAFPTTQDNVSITNVSNDPVVNMASSCRDITIAPDAVLTINSTFTLEVRGSLTNSAGTTGLVIKSDVSGTGSLWVCGNVSGSATVERYMTPDVWHLISSPTSTQPIIEFLVNNLDIPLSHPPALPHYSFGMTDFSSGAWNPYFTDTKPVTDLFGAGRGYLVKTQSPIDYPVMSFEGALNTFPIADVSAVPGWNLLGNPFTTAININTFAGTHNNGTNFLEDNSIVLTGSYAAVYFWDPTTVSYLVVNDATTATCAAVGQGFFVRNTTLSPVNIVFKTSLRAPWPNPAGSALFKSAQTPYPEIRLIAKSADSSASTLIKFIEGTHEGLDVGYDAGIFKTNSDFSLYTKLVEDNGIEFQLQCLPTNKYDKLVIPLGIDCKAGGEIVFTVETVQLEASCKTILEDKLTNTFTDLSKNSYKTVVVANTATSDRFFLHTGDIISGLKDQVLPGKLTAYTNGNKEIRILGEVQDNAVAKLYNGLGQVVLTKKLGAGNLNIIGLPNLTSGIYLLNIDDKGTTQTIKIIVR